MNCGARPPDAVLDVVCVRTEAVSGLRFDILKSFSISQLRTQAKCKAVANDAQVRGCLARWCLPQAGALGQL